MKEVKLWLKSLEKRVTKDRCVSDPEYWSSIAREYDRKVIANGKLIGKIRKYVNRNTTVLDIGAGTGYLTLALAPAVKRVIAVEPSEAMLNILREKAEKLNIHNITYIPGKWEDVKTDKCDIVLASHSILCSHDPLNFFLKMYEYSNKYIFIIVFTDFDAISRKVSFPSYVLLYNMLCSLGVYPNIEIFKSYRRFFFKSKEDAVTKLRGRINKKYIQKNIKNINGELFLDIETNEVMMWYRK